LFTGIVEEAGRVEFLNEGRLRIRAERVLEDLAQGDSVAVNGACLTAVSVNSKGFEVDLVPETLRRTNLGDLKQGSTVNLERSLAANARLGGHIVQGHVDAAAKISSMEAEVDAVNVRIEAPEGLIRYIVEKGFIAVDGISLTVVKAFSSSFTTSVIPYTLKNTNLRGRKVGDLVNLEVDILAKYVESLLPSHRQS
jgi:riboflavin synthase